MDILRFINSKDIREYLKTINYKFNSLEAAWLIYQSRATIEEKHNAWKELIRTMPDCKIEKRMNTIPQESLHGFLRKFIDYEENILDEFYTQTKDCVYTLELYDYKIWFPKDTFYETFDSIQKSVVNEWNESSVYRVTKQKFERTKSITVYFDKNNQPYKYYICGYPAALTDIIEGVFDGLWFDFPTPFPKGDILCEYDVTGAESKGFCAGPFVMKGITPVDTREWAIKNGDNSDMNAWGYFIDDNGNLYSEVMHNYMNLEYYRGDLKGKKRVLKALSNFISGEIDVTLFANAYHYILCEENLKDNIPRGYTKEGLYLAGIGVEEYL